MEQRCLEEAAAFFKEEYNEELDDETINQILDEEYPEWKKHFIENSSQFFCDMVFSSSIKKQKSINRVKDFLCIESYNITEGN